MLKQFLLFNFFLLFVFQTEAKIVKISIDKREPYANNKTFGTVGHYEKLTGRAFGEIDPLDSRNALIQDIQFAPKNANGMVEYVTEFILLQPENLEKTNGLLFLCLPNRGNAFPADPALLERGYVYLWCAWQGDVLEGNNRLTIKVPIATNNGVEITGKIRSEFQVTKAESTLSLSSGAFTGNSHHSYETVSLDNRGLVLTKRVHETDPRMPVPNEDWVFADCNETDFSGIPSPTMISIKGGFDPNYIYELIYTAKNPLVLGLGFAAIRDLTSFLKHETKDVEPMVNPLLLDQKTNPIKAAIMFGVSQCGGFTRTFLQLGFNQDENGKIVFEGVNGHIGPRRLPLNVRFGRSGGVVMQHEDHLYPGNEAPFTWATSYDPISKINGGILDRCMATNTCPKIMETSSSTEYWQSRMSLRTTDALGKKDILIPENVRIYFHLHNTYLIPE